jgi:hypothetical protein
MSRRTNGQDPEHPIRDIAIPEEPVRPTPKRRRRARPGKSGRKVTVHVTIKNTPPDAGRLAAQREAIETILAALTRD